MRVLVAGATGAIYAELIRGADNHRARRQLGFDPRSLPWIDRSATPT